MIKPPKAVVISDGASRKKVYAYDYDALWRYCDQLQAEKKALADLIGQYSKLAEHDQEIESLKGK